MSLVQSAFGLSGRSTVSGAIVTVFGATGFLGKYTVHRLARIGAQIIIPYRGDEYAFQHLKVYGELGQIIPIRYSLRNVQSIEQAVSRSTVVINLLGRRWDTAHFTLDETHNTLPRLVAEISKSNGVERFVHVSASAASPDSSSKWARTKAAGEASIREVFPKATIFRPTLLFGAEDRFLKNFCYLISRRQSVPRVQGLGVCQPLYVNDMAQIIAESIAGNDESFEGKTIPVGGPETFSYDDIVTMIVKTLKVEEYPNTVLSFEQARRYIRYLESWKRDPLFTEDELGLYAQSNTVPLSPVLQDFHFTQMGTVLDTLLAPFVPPGVKE